MTRFFGKSQRQNRHSVGHVFDILSTSDSAMPFCLARRRSHQNRCFLPGGNFSEVVEKVFGMAGRKEKKGQLLVQLPDFLMT